VCLELACFRPSSPAGHAHFSRARQGTVGLCPAFVRAAGHVQWWGWAAWGMPIYCSTGYCSTGRSRGGGRCRAIMSSPRGGRGACPVVGVGSVGHALFSRPGPGALGLCPAFASRRGHVPRKSRRPGRGGPNWAMPESSGILVSAFDSEATGEFA
jgi:hypothetical protein